MATHNRAGEIVVEQIGPLTFRATIITYTVPDSPADRPSLEINWGDGVIDTLLRSNGAGEGVVIQPGVKKNIYIGTHTYQGPSVYIISMLDPNRNAGIVNIDDSVNIPFYIETQVIISPFFGYNSTPQLLNPPIDNACVMRRYEHNPGAWDIDGDSLSYELVECQQGVGQPVGYTFPNGISINAVTGDLVWEYPVQQGEYNFAIMIREWRRIAGSSTPVNLGYMIRDMQVTVLPCQNNPPIVETIDEICVEAGDTVRFWVKAYDPDQDPVTLTATGGPISITDSPASFFQPTFSNDTARSQFIWPTVCSHVRQQPHSMSFRAIDTPPLAQEPLVDYHTVFITVVGPAPKNPTATPQGNAIQLNWDMSICGNVVGYKIYRRIEEYGFVPDTCEVGVPGYTGYSFIASTTGLNGNFYLDDNNGAGLARGIRYCYMVVACFPDGAVGYASEEFCAELKRDLPIITNVSVEATSATAGVMYVAWSKPTELDPVQTPGPFEYRVYRTDAQNQTPVLRETYFNLNDTTYLDNGLNTEELEYRYYIELFNATNGNSFVVGNSETATSIFLNAAGQDNSVLLTWNEIVPWINDTFEIYRQNPALNFVLIGATTQRTYRDTGLSNGTEYCYKIQSRGRYSIDSIIDPILNWSQETCAIPIDTMPPCTQAVDILRDCDNFQNTLTWANNGPDCPNDIIEFRVYHTPVFGGDLQLLASFPAVGSGNTFVHDNLQSVAGCYAVAAVDSFMNVSVIDTFCVDNCPLYELPNVFTPGSDNFNDVFRPFPYRFVQDVDMKIYNRWGLLMFETTDPAIGWKGDSKQTNLPVSDGVYYYICTVNEIRLEGIVPRHLKGFIQLFRNTGPGPN